MKHVKRGTLVVYQQEHMVTPRVAVIESTGNLLLHLRDGKDVVVVNVLTDWVHRFDEHRKILVPINVKQPENTPYDPEFDRQIDWFET